MHIVLVEDNVVLARSTSRVLQQEGFATSTISDGAEAQTWLIDNHKSYDLVILDILLPSIDGFSICKTIRSEGVKTPVLMLTSKDALEDTITGFNCGADDYLKKPFAVDELLARVRSLLRRPPLTVNDVSDIIPGVSIDMKSHKVVTTSGDNIKLTTKEFTILVYFIRHPNQIINQQTLHDHVFDYAEVQTSNAVEVHIKNIRKKFKEENNEIPLTTIRNAGYRLDI